MEKRNEALALTVIDDINVTYDTVATVTTVSKTAPAKTHNNRPSGQVKFGSEASLVGTDNQKKSYVDVPKRTLSEPEVE